MYISVIGGDVGSAGEKDLKMAEDLGEELAERGHTIVCGGRGGVMREVCKGAKRKGGTTIGILPSSSRDEANEYIDHAIVTNLGIMRNTLVVMNGDVIIAIDGAYGTLSEICFAQRYGKDILGINTWEIDAVDDFDEVDDLIEELEKLES
ncbi:MAG: TIGR00725 family protein [Candidatus Thermoplasmatota archaeon]|nr:TIGR00725 family protein [Candidatus Thermoplasmatota archaeon]MBS3789473.1 TIGR00725 family protein [Candidatus Thermoplasmatota archaeon]